MDGETLAKSLFLVMILGFLGCAFAIGWAAGTEGHQTKAIEAGVAEWRIDPKTGEKSFHFITPAKVEKETK